MDRVGKEERFATGILPMMSFDTSMVSCVPDQAAQSTGKSQTNKVETRAVCIHLICSQKRLIWNDWHWTTALLLTYLKPFLPFCWHRTSPTQFIPSKNCMFLLRQQQIQTVFLWVEAIWNSFLPHCIPFHFKSSLLDTYKIHTSVKSSYQIW